MSKASANRASLYAVKEVTWGVTPSNPALKELRYTGEQIDASQSFEKSQEIRSDRMVSDTVQVDASPAGSINVEISGASYDDFLEGVMMSAWSAQLNIAGVAGDITATAAASSNLTSTTSGKFTNVVVGQWIRLSGFTATANNTFYKVTAKPNNQTLTVVPQPASTETPAGTAAKVDGSYIRNGVTEQSWTLTKIFNDATVATRHNFTGMRVGGMSMDLSTGAILTGSFNFMGKGSSWSESAFAGESQVAASTTEVMNSVTDVFDIQQNGTAFAAGSIMQLGLEIDNQHREQKGIGVLGNAGVAAGQLMVNATAQQYFESKAQADLFSAATSFSFSFRVTGRDGYTYIFTMPKCKYESFVANASGLDSDVMADTQFTALRDATTNCMLQIDRFAPVV